MIMEDFVTFEQAKKLKELGFHWECNHFYCQPKGKELKRICYIPNDFLDSLYHDFNNPTTWSDNSAETFSAPTLTQVQKWLREVKGVTVYIIPYFLSEECAYYLSFMFRGYGEDKKYGTKDTWEKALSAGINEAIKVLKNEEKNRKPWYEQ